MSTHVIKRRFRCVKCDTLYSGQPGLVVNAALASGKGNCCPGDKLCKCELACLCPDCSGNHTVEATAIKKNPPDMQWGDVSVQWVSLGTKWDAATDPSKPAPFIGFDPAAAGKDSTVFFTVKKNSYDQTVEILDALRVGRNL